VSRTGLTFAYLTLIPFLLAAPAFLAVLLGLGAREVALRDLERMRAGLMDPAGARLTEQAAYRGLDGVVIALTALLFWGWFLMILSF
jgi:hypothetical protein